MRFNEIISNQIEVDDEVIEDYIRKTDEEDYSTSDFLDFLCTEYYIGDFVETEDYKYTLEKDYLLDEIKRVKEQMK